MKLVVAMLVLSLLGGCAQVERILYETGESYRQQQCRQNLGEDCERRTSYDAYQAEREQGRSP